MKSGASLAPPTPELPVKDVRLAQAFYRDKLGFEIAWHNEEGSIGAVSRGRWAVFFREAPGEIPPAVFWIFAEDIEQAYEEFRGRGAEISSDLADTPWGLRQFTLRDLNGHKYHVHHDL